MLDFVCHGDSNPRSWFPNTALQVSAPTIAEFAATVGVSELQGH
jgi:hypothetical protein